MTDEDLLELISLLRSTRAEVPGVEVKRAREALPSSIPETLSSFSNTAGGGVIVLGLDERARFVTVGVADPPTALRKLQGMCVDSMEPPVAALINLHLVEGVTLLVAEVPELEPERKPCFYKGAGLTNGAYRRVGDGDHRMTQYEVAQMISSRGQPAYDSEPVPGATAGDLDPNLVAALLARVRSVRPSFTNEDEQNALRRLRVLVSSAVGDPEVLVPSLAGLLCLGRHPQDFFGQLTVTFVHYPDVAPGPGEVRFLDSRSFEGPLPWLVRDTLAAIRANMTRRAVMRGAGRAEVLEYPEAALREAVVNALIHRDYSPAARGSQVQVEMYPDRIAIRSPGGFYGPVGPDRLGEPGVSSTRNTVLVRLLEDVFVPGEPGAVCENRGSGIPVMVRALREAGLPPPTFADQLSSVEVTFSNHTLLDAESLAWLSGLRADGLSTSQSEALVLMRRGGVFTNSTYRDRFLLDSRDATAELRDLVRRDLVEMTGARRWATYLLPPALTAETKPAEQVLERSGPRRVLEELRVGDELTRAELADRLGEKDRTVLSWLDELRSTAPNLIERLGHARSPLTRYRITGDGRALLER